MCITIYTHPELPESNATVQQFIDAGLGITVYCPQRNPDAVRGAGVVRFPTVHAKTVEGDFHWVGHRPDLIAMLADLLAVGQVTAAIDNYDDAADAVLTRQQALREIRDHQLNVEDFLAQCGDQPLYRGQAVLDWLGY